MVKWCSRLRRFLVIAWSFICGRGDGIGNTLVTKRVIETLSWNVSITRINYILLVMSSHFVLSTCKDWLGSSIGLHNMSSGTPKSSLGSNWSIPSIRASLNKPGSSFEGIHSSPEYMREITFSTSWGCTPVSTKVDRAPPPAFTDDRSILNYILAKFVYF